MKDPKIKGVKSLDEMTHEDFLNLADAEIEELAKREAIAKGVKFVNETPQEVVKPDFEFEPTEAVYKFEVNLVSQDLALLQQLKDEWVKRFGEIKTCVYVETYGDWQWDVRPYTVKEVEISDRNVSLELVVDGKYNLSGSQYQRQAHLFKEYNKALKDIKDNNESLNEYEEIVSDIYDLRYRAKCEEDALTRKAMVFGKYLEVENDIAKAKKYYQGTYDVDNDELLEIVEKWEKIKLESEENANNNDQ